MARAEECLRLYSSSGVSGRRDLDLCTLEGAIGCLRMGIQGHDEYYQSRRHRSENGPEELKIHGTGYSDKCGIPNGALGAPQHVYEAATKGNSRQYVVRYAPFSGSKPAL
ncbi:hypothetical protein E4U50_000932 [Claviceps purpurea]|nr:hypothetical protein E4U50_000932 [Claviceps purpurea]